MKKKLGKNEIMIGILGLMVALSGPARANLLINGDFANQAEGKPADWKFYQNRQEVEIDTEETTGDSQQSLRVDIVKDAGKSYGQIVQKVPVSPNTRYMLKADIKSTKEGIGLTQIKLIVGGSEASRIEGGGRSGTDWTTFEREFGTGDANMVWIVLRYKQGAEEAGQKVWFANISLDAVAEAGADPAAQ